ncbi:hypothetical protein B0H65DRAFT_570335 [Neurospora tetraspora]|uniref:Uncharacterized protein n=1 Tax=Neurospora tetraspora TaxID=94610 RepID=A0AAE0JGM3_9PEZI|nr:hypothetical protein B0H65DRAFT_570335 [Neurospora tetraspora]
MQRWTFPSFRLPTGTTNTHSGNIHPQPIHHDQMEATHPRNNPSRSQGLQPNQAHNPSPKHNHIERTLRSRITKQKAKNERLRKNIANLEAKSAYLRRLKGLEKEVEQLEKEGRELARREKEVRRVVEAGEEGLEEKGEEKGEGWGVDGDDQGGDDGDEDDEEGARGGGRDRTRNIDGEGSVKREEEGSEKEREGSVWRFKREDEGKVKVKQEAEAEVKDSLDIWIEEIELLSSAAAWRWLDSRLAVEI